MENMKQDISGANTGEQKRYWGLWATIGFSFIVCLVFILVQVVAVVLLGDFIISTQPEKDPGLVIHDLENNGLFLAITLLLTSIICSGLIVAFAALHRQTSVKEYLHFQPVALKQLLPYLGIMLVFAASYNGLCYFLDKPIMTGHPIALKSAMFDIKSIFPAADFPKPIPGSRIIRSSDMPASSAASRPVFKNPRTSPTKSS